MAIITNDGWYRDAIALYQHLGHAVLRALENQRFVVRAGNTGISAFIDQHGRIISQSLPLQATALSYWLRPEDRSTQISLYTRWGDWPLYLGFLAFILAEIRYRKRLQNLPAS